MYCGGGKKWDLFLLPFIYQLFTSRACIDPRFASLSRMTEGRDTATPNHPTYLIIPQLDYR